MGTSWISRKGESYKRWGGGGPRRDLENTNPAPVKIKQYLNKNLTDPYQSFNLNKSLLINQYLPTLI